MLSRGILVLDYDPRERDNGVAETQVIPGTGQRCLVNMEDDQRL